MHPVFLTVRPWERLILIPGQKRRFALLKEDITGKDVKYAEATSLDLTDVMFLKT
jgi:hypothetical protein